MAKFAEKFLSTESAVDAIKTLIAAGKKEIVQELLENDAFMQHLVSQFHSLTINTTNGKAGLIGDTLAFFAVDDSSSLLIFDKLVEGLNLIKTSKSGLIASKLSHVISTSSVTVFQHLSKLLPFMSTEFGDQGVLLVQHLNSSSTTATSHVRLQTHPVGHAQAHSRRQGEDTTTHHHAPQPIKLATFIGEPLRLDNGAFKAGFKASETLADFAYIPERKALLSPVGTDSTSDGRAAQMLDAATRPSLPLKALDIGLTAFWENGGVLRYICAKWMPGCDDVLQNRTAWLGNTTISTRILSTKVGHELVEHRTEIGWVAWGIGRGVLISKGAPITHAARYGIFTGVDFAADRYLHPESRDFVSCLQVAGPKAISAAVAVWPAGLMAIPLVASRALNSELQCVTQGHEKPNLGLPLYAVDATAVALVVAVGKIGFATTLGVPGFILTGLTFVVSTDSSARMALSIDEVHTFVGEHKQEIDSAIIGGAIGGSVGAVVSVGKVCFAGKIAVAITASVWPIVGGVVVGAALGTAWAYLPQGSSDDAKTVVVNAAASARMAVANYAANASSIFVNYTSGVHSRISLGKGPIVEINSARRRSGEALPDHDRLIEAVPHYFLSSPTIISKASSSSAKIDEYPIYDHNDGQPLLSPSRHQLPPSPPPAVREPATTPLADVTYGDSTGASQIDTTFAANRDSRTHDIETWLGTASRDGVVFANIPDVMAALDSCKRSANEVEYSRNIAQLRTAVPERGKFGGSARKTVETRNLFDKVVNEAELKAPFKEQSKVVGDVESNPFGEGPADPVSKESAPRGRTLVNRPTLGDVTFTLRAFTENYGGVMYLQHKIVEPVYNKITSSKSGQYVFNTRFGQIAGRFVNEAALKVSDAERLLDKVGSKSSICFDNYCYNLAFGALHVVETAAVTLTSGLGFKSAAMYELTYLTSSEANKIGHRYIPQERNPSPEKYLIPVASAFISGGSGTVLLAWGLSRKLLVGGPLTLAMGSISAVTAGLETYTGGQVIQDTGSLPYLTTAVVGASALAAAVFTPPLFCAAAGAAVVPTAVFAVGSVVAKGFLVMSVTQSTFHMTELTMTASEDVRNAGHSLDAKLSSAYDHCDAGLESFMKDHSTWVGPTLGGILGGGALSTFGIAAATMCSCAAAPAVGLSIAFGTLGALAAAGAVYAYETAYPMEVVGLPSAQPSTAEVAV